MYPRILWELVGSLFLFGLGVVGGYHLASTQCELEKLEFYNDALEKQAQADRKTQDMENVYKDALVNAQSGVVLDLERINADFTGASLDLSSWSDGMRYNEAGADSTEQLSDTPAASSAVSEKKCGCSATDRTKLQRLYEQQLVIARDCDITTSYYNRLLEMYKTISSPR